MVKLAAMRTIKILIIPFLSICAGTCMTAVRVSAQDTTGEEAQMRFKLPESNDGLAGSGPVRRYDWFQRLWQSRRSQWAKDVNKDQGAVVFLGDSITQGWGPNMSDEFGDMKVANRGISGDTTRGMLMRLDEDVLSVNPKAVVMLMGTNDLEEGAHPASVGANVMLILKRLREHDPKMPVILCKVFPSSASKKRPAKAIKEVNGYLERAADGEPRITLLDTWSLFANESGDAKPDEFPDLLHPNDKGYAKWAAALRPAFDKLGLLPKQEASTGTAHPNIVFILADDLGYMDISPNNPGTFYETPNLQRLADSGMRFTQGYAACPVCSPTRSSILTGQYPARTRNTDYFGAPNQYPQSVPAAYDPAADAEQKKKLRGHGKRPVWPAPYIGNLAKEHTTLAEKLKSHGYATFFAGKWHLGQEGSWPEDHGFDINKGGISRGGPYGGKKYFSPYGNPRLEDGPEGEHLPDRLASETARFIADKKDEPFLAYLSFYSVHTPLIGRPDLVEKYKNRKAEIAATEEAIWGFDLPRKVRRIQEHAVYGAMVEAMDLAVGKVLDALESNGVADRTLVVFFSDNGGLSTSEGWPTSNLPLRAGKGWLYEGGIREPMLVRWPGITKPGSICTEPVTSTDFFPTLLEACNLPPMPDQHVDGVSFAPLLRDPTAQHERPPLFWHYAHWGNQGGIPGSVIRDGDWKLIDFYWSKSPELYDLGNDPAEAHNLSSSKPDTMKELLAKLNEWRKSVDAIPPTVNPDFEGEFEKW